MAKSTILVVDDTPDNIAFMEEVLCGQFRVQAATSGARALEICGEADPPDLVLLDIMMPGMDGYAVCARLKEDPRTARIPVIFVTSMNDDDDEAKGLALGAVDYIIKPISPTIVVQRVRTHLELLAARRKLESLSLHYSSYLSPELVAGIRAGGIASSVGTRRKKMTVFFSDIEGFTRISESMSPEDMTFALNFYFEAMARIVIARRGTLDKYIGDAIMVFFGDPESQGLKEDAVACVSMALEMQRAIPLVEAAWRERGILASLRIRIGIASGFCAVGNFGSSSQLTYTILGTPVNLASRLESTGITGSVVVSEETEYLVRDRFSNVPRTPLAIKGIHHPVNSWEIIDDLR
ncbi:MAG: hypothetical protein A2413_08480 [Treponema sp. RIFOXYC1_FULL_61_9]|nr:MAG: hypothetical protein A2413_08480 [Treponema sp. RIFOXYC1_FULL_61_9]